MQFHFLPKSVGADHWTAGFTLDRIWSRSGQGQRDLSHLFDRSYMYHSARELQWHLAHRFGLAAQTVEVTSEA